MALDAIVMNNIKGQIAVATPRQPAVDMELVLRMALVIVMKDIKNQIVPTQLIAEDVDFTEPVILLRAFANVREVIPEIIVKMLLIAPA
jgi:uncharacterized membrane protein YecN with MAPEG domain